MRSRSEVLLGSAYRFIVQTKASDMCFGSIQRRKQYDYERVSCAKSWMCRGYWKPKFFDACLFLARESAKWKGGIHERERTCVAIVRGIGELRWSIYTPGMSVWARGNRKELPHSCAPAIEVFCVTLLLAFHFVLPAPFKNLKKTALVFSAIKFSGCRSTLVPFELWWRNNPGSRTLQYQERRYREAHIRGSTEVWTTCVSTLEHKRMYRLYM